MARGKDMSSDLQATFAYGVDLGYPENAEAALDYMEERYELLSQAGCMLLLYGEEAAKPGLAIVVETLELSANYNGVADLSKWGHDRPLQKDPNWAAERLENLLEALGFDTDYAWCSHHRAPWPTDCADLVPNWRLFASSF